MIKFPKTIDPAAPEFEFFNEVIGTPIVQGRLSGKLEFGSSATIKIKHKLGRPVRGYLCTWRTADANFSVDTTNTRPESELWLTNSLAGAVTAEFWIF